VIPTRSAYVITPLANIQDEQWPKDWTSSVSAIEIAGHFQQTDGQLEMIEENVDSAIGKSSPARSDSTSSVP
jgi:hypothetical protein